MPCCDTCACLAEPGLECLSVLDPKRFGRFAEWCRLDESTEANVRRRSHVLARSRLGIAPVRVDADPPARASLAEALAVNRRMLVCPWRDTRTDCGCGGLARCAVGLGRNGLVNHQDCFACLRSELPQSSPRAARAPIILPAPAIRSIRISVKLKLR